MGIPNLLRFLKPFIEPVHIKKYAGKRVGIDAYSWLHKGAYSCSMELCVNPKSSAARRYISYFMHHINLLRHHKVVPVVVFDGGSMPCKAATDNERRKKRQLSLNMAKEMLEQGNTAAAMDLFRKAVHITPSMVYQLVQILRSENVEFVVAPYEADAQLAYLTTIDADQGGISAVVTEDSDLIAYCCPAMDRFGNGEEFTMERTLKTEKDGLSFRDFDKNLFTESLYSHNSACHYVKGVSILSPQFGQPFWISSRFYPTGPTLPKGMCVLAGCDFLPSISGIGTKRAYSLVSKYKDINHVISNLKVDKRYSVPDDYADSLWKTLAVFGHARIYDVKSKSLKHLKPLDEQCLTYLDGDLNILGPSLSPSVARGIAEGHLNPVTMEAFGHYKPINAIKFIDTSAFDIVNKFGSQEVLTQNSCISALSSPESKENMIVNEISSDGQMCKKGVALGKFLVQKQSPRMGDNEVGPENIPENNPFKKRKLSTKQVQEMDPTELLIDLQNEESNLSGSSLSEESSQTIKNTKLLSISQDYDNRQNLLVNEEPVAIYSSLTRAKSIPKKLNPTRQTILKKSKDKTYQKVNGESGILKFFKRL